MDVTQNGNCNEYEELLSILVIYEIPSGIRDKDRTTNDDQLLT